MNKKDCNICLKKFTKKTLDKRDGICGRCFNKKNNNNSRRGKISKTLKRQIWNKYFPNTSSGKCQMCEITIIDTFTFECGHDIPHSRNGIADINNLFPICSHCNKSMGTKTKSEFKSFLLPNNIKPAIKYDNCIECKVFLNYNKDVEYCLECNPNLHYEKTPINRLKICPLCSINGCENYDVCVCCSIFR